MVYFMQAADGGAVKIGFSDDVEARRCFLEYHYQCSLVILATMKGGREEEREIHGRFSHLRYGKTEQFRPTAELMAFIGRPLLASPNPDAVLAMEPPEGRTVMVIIHLKGTRAYAEWLEEIHRKTHLPKATIFRLAIAEWAKGGGHKLPPEF